MNSIERNPVLPCGTTATVAKGNIVGPGRYVAQVRQIFLQGLTHPRTLRCSLANIVEAMESLLSLDDYGKTAQSATYLQ
jgi:hypothetical protein